MPVYVPGGYCTQEIFGEKDIIHTCLTDKTKLKVLSDVIWFNDPGMDFSIGDLFEEACEYTFWPFFVLFVYKSLKKD